MKRNPVRIAAVAVEAAAATAAQIGAMAAVTAAAVQTAGNYSFDPTN